MHKILTLMGSALLLAGCSAAGSTGAPSGTSSFPTSAASTAPARYQVETGADKVVLRVTTGGGFVPLGYMLTELPEFTLYGDGRIVTRGPIPEIYPSPLLPNLLQRHVTPAEIQTILAAADVAGLLGPDARYDATNIMDAGSTTFLTNVGGKAHTIGAYALFEAGTNADAAITAARSRLRDFQGKIENLPALLGRAMDDTAMYQPTAMRVFTSPATDVQPPVDVAQPLVAWPLAADPVEGLETRAPDTLCTLVAGADLALFLKAAAPARAVSLWTAPSGTYSVRVRPLLPDETGCGAAAG